MVLIDFKSVVNLPLYFITRPKTVISSSSRSVRDVQLCIYHTGCGLKLYTKHLPLIGESNLARKGRAHTWIGSTYYDHVLNSSRFAHFQSIYQLNRFNESPNQNALKWVILTVRGPRRIIKQGSASSERGERHEAAGRAVDA
jgi:hypothetical protein